LRVSVDHHRDATISLIFANRQSRNKSSYHYWRINRIKDLWQRLHDFSIGLCSMVVSATAQKATAHQYSQPTPILPIFQNTITLASAGPIALMMMHSPCETELGLASSCDTIMKLRVSWLCTAKCIDLARLFWRCKKPRDNDLRIPMACEDHSSADYPRFQLTLPLLIEYAPMVCST
jgi:hypothetical protein